MHPALTFQFERAVNEYAQWQAVPAEDRSDAPAWWWDTAISADDETATMPVEWCATLGVADESTYAKGAARSSDKLTCRSRRIFHASLRRLRGVLVCFNP